MQVMLFENVCLAEQTSFDGGLMPLMQIMPGLEVLKSRPSGLKPRPRLPLTLTSSKETDSSEESSAESERLC